MTKKPIWSCEIIFSSCSTAINASKFGISISSVYTILVSKLKAQVNKAVSNKFLCREKWHCVLVPSKEEFEPFLRPIMAVNLSNLKIKKNRH